jgi:hypothetical protein
MLLQPRPGLDPGIARTPLNWGFERVQSQPRYKVCLPRVNCFPGATHFKRGAHYATAGRSKGGAQTRRVSASPVSASASSQLASSDDAEAAVLGPARQQCVRPGRGGALVASRIRSSRSVDAARSLRRTTTPAAGSLAMVGHDPKRRGGASPDPASLGMNFQVYCAEKFWKQLNREGIVVARCTLTRLKAMRLQGAVWDRAFKTTTIPGQLAERPRDLVGCGSRRPVQTSSGFGPLRTWLRGALEQAIAERGRNGRAVGASQRQVPCGAVQSRARARVSRREHSRFCRFRRPSATPRDGPPLAPSDALRERASGGRVG